MRYLCILIMVGFLSVAFAVKAEDGKGIFDSLHCGICHKADRGSAVTPSLKQIAGSYKGKENQLLNYLKGEAPSVINPKKGEKMERYIEKTKSLKEEQRKALADFILSHGS